uniref:Transposase n=1 Tax=Bursaphelenchus xylophilus TaxID=6326 RepID=A0A1I7SJG8_BURXY
VAHGPHRSPASNPAKRREIHAL